MSLDPPYSRVDVHKGRRKATQVETYSSSLKKITRFLTDLLGWERGTRQCLKLWCSSDIGNCLSTISVCVGGNDEVIFFL